MVIASTDDNGLGITIDAKNNNTVIKGAGNTIATFSETGMDLKLQVKNYYLMAVNYLHQLD